MKKFYVMLLLALFCGAAAAQTTGNVNVMLGKKTLESDPNTWGAWNEQAEFGVLIDVAGQEWPVSIAIDLLGSAESKYGITASTSEFDLGVRKVFNVANTPIHPYIGGGLAFITARWEIDGTGISIEDNGSGVWLSGGAFVTLGEHFNLGLELRHSTADVDFGTATSGDAGGNHAGILLGYHW